MTDTFHLFILYTVPTFTFNNPRSNQAISSKILVKYEKQKANRDIKLDD